MYRLQFYLWFKFYCCLFLGTLMYDNELERRKFSHSMDSCHLSSGILLYLLCFYTVVIQQFSYFSLDNV